jgi:hypothetical protein
MSILNSNDTLKRILTLDSYLVNYKQSSALRELRLDHCYLSGKDVALLLHSMIETPGKARELHFDVSENNIEEYLDELTNAIRSGLAPSSMTIRLIEFEKESDFRNLIHALARNNTIRHLDISRASLPCEASADTCQALEWMFSDNETLEWLDISGEDSRLETTKLGVGINKALRGLEKNRTLRVLLVKCECELISLPLEMLTLSRSKAWTSRCKYSCRCTQDKHNAAAGLLRE